MCPLNCFAVKHDTAIPAPRQPVPEFVDASRSIVIYLELLRIQIRPPANQECTGVAVCAHLIFGLLERLKVITIRRKPYPSYWNVPCQPPNRPVPVQPATGFVNSPPVALLNAMRETRPRISTVRHKTSEICGREITSRGVSFATWNLRNHYTLKRDCHRSDVVSRHQCALPNLSRSMTPFP